MTASRLPQMSKKILSINSINMQSINRILTLIPAILIFLVTSCDGQSVRQASLEAPLSDTAIDNYGAVLQDREDAAANKQKDNLGELVETIVFQVKTDNTTDFPDGKIPWASIEKASEDIPNLIDRDKVVIMENKLTLIIDYPLTFEYRVNLESPDGFTTEELLVAINKEYFNIYEVEEKTASVKTVAPDKRVGLANRNQTNGKYGIWGHDIADLVLSEVKVYKTPEGQILLSLGIES